MFDNLLEYWIYLGDSPHTKKKFNRLRFHRIPETNQVWGIVLGHAASNWGNYTLNQQLPTYLANVLRLEQRHCLWGNLRSPDDEKTSVYLNFFFRFSLSFNGLLASFCYLVKISPTIPFAKKKFSRSSDPLNCSCSEKLFFSDTKHCLRLRSCTDWLDQGERVAVNNKGNTKALTSI